MPGIVLALEALNGVLALTQASVAAGQQIQTMLATAHAENRDLTDAEVQAAIASRKAAEAALQAHATALATPSAPTP